MAVKCAVTTDLSKLFDCFNCDLLAHMELTISCLLLFIVIFETVNREQIERCF